MAALMVVVAHALPALYPFYSILGYLGHGGYAGVELFFVLSGFLIGRILLRLGNSMTQKVTVFHFWIRRWLRTLPFFFLVCVFWYLWFYFHDEHVLPWGEYLGHVFFVRNGFEFRMTFCGESWSLAVEEWFYLLFPVFLYLALKVTRSFAVAILSTACLFGVYSLAFRLHGATIPEYSWSLQQRMLVTMRFDALMVGVLGACWWYYHQALWLRLRWIAFLLGLVALGIVYYSLYWGDNAGLFAKVWRFSLTSVGFLLLFPLASQWRTLWPQWAAKLIRLLALSSYVLYLTHGIWNTWMDLLPGAAPKSVAGGYYLFTEKVLGSVLFACLIYWVIERPLMRFRDRVSPGSVPRPQSYSNEPSR